jgi:hypothetical protein
MEFNLFMELICNPGFDPNFPDSVFRTPSIANAAYELYEVFCNIDT